MSERATQCERLAAWASSGHTLVQDEWYTSAPDGGGRITAVRSRVADLEQAGIRFHHRRRSNGMREYILAEIDEPIAQPQAPVDPEPQAVEQLKLDVPPSPRSAALHDWEGR